MIDEGHLARAAGVAARVLGGQEFGPAAQAGAEYVAQKGENFLKKTVDKLKASGMKKPEPVHEMTGHYMSQRAGEAKNRVDHHSDEARKHLSLAADHEDKSDYDTSSHHDLAADLHQRAASHFLKARTAYGNRDKSLGDHHMLKGENMGDAAHAHAKKEPVMNEADMSSKNYPTGHNKATYHTLHKGERVEHPSKEAAMAHAKKVSPNTASSNSNHAAQVFRVDKHGTKTHAWTPDGQKRHLGIRDTKPEDMGKPIDEISNKTVGRYLKHANRSQRELDNDSANNYDFEDGDNDAHADRQAEKADDRRQHMDKAKRRLRPKGSNFRMIKPTTGMHEEVNEMYGKGSIDAIGAFHAKRSGKRVSDGTFNGTKKNPPEAAAYHGIQRKRAARLKDIRDGNGPLGPDTTFKKRAEYAREDSKKAKALKPVSEQTTYLARLKSPAGKVVNVNVTGHGDGKQKEALHTAHKAFPDHEPISSVDSRYSKIKGTSTVKHED